MKQWHCLFEKMELSPSEKKSVARFLGNSSGLRFLPLVTILKNRHYTHEAVELLSWGLSQVPDYVPARVMLGRELYLLGIVRAAWDTLQPVLTRDLDNFLAYKTAFSCALLLGDRKQTLLLGERLEKANKYDNEVRSLLHCLLIEGFAKAQAMVRRQLASQGITPALLSGQQEELVGLAAKEPTKKIPRAEEQKHPTTASNPPERIQMVPLAQVWDFCAG